MLTVLRRLFSFSDWNRSHPKDPPPGDMLDASFDAQNARIAELEALIEGIRRDDGGLRNGVVTIDSLSPDLRRQLRLAAAPQLSNGDELGWKTAEATAEVWARASMDWAENMPGTIPDGSVAVMDISGDHWSSRWWAHQAAVSVSSRYGGVFISDTAPADPTEGLCWWSSVTGNLMIWYVDQDSAQWVQISTSRSTVRLAIYTVATVPSAAISAIGAVIYVSNESGGAVPAFSDGTNWRRVTDRAVIT